MRLADYYNPRERRLAGWFAVGCAAYFTVLAATSALVLLSGRGMIVLPLQVMMFVQWLLDGCTKGMGMFAVVVLAAPLWHLVRSGRAAALLAAEAAFKTVGVAFAVFCAAFMVFFGTMLSLHEEIESSRPGREKVERYANAGDLKGSAFAAFMVPETAISIRVFEDAGFGFRHCSISCTVGREDLGQFAHRLGYRFEQKERLPVFPEDPVLDEFHPFGEDTSRYLYCSARENKREIPGWGREGCLSFIYDTEAERLYASYHE